MRNQSNQNASTSWKGIGNDNTKRSLNGNFGNTASQFIGRRACANGTTGSDNILIGNGAGIRNNADSNMFVGSFAGNANTIGAGNALILGSIAGVNSATSSSTVGIGTPFRWRRWT